MPRCDCGFDFARALLKGRKIESYAVINDKDYRKVLRKEHAIFAEKKPLKRLRLIADVAPFVGNLMLCPRCGAWLVAKPIREGRGDYAVLRQKQRGS